MIHVIIPVYNVEKFIEQCVQSVLKQPYKNIDIVMIDDGSTDNSGQICDYIAAKNKRVSIIHQKNKGLSAARNIGIEFILSKSISNDDYITFLDSDDAWIPNTIDASFADEYLSGDVIAFPFYYANSELNRFSQRSISIVGEIDEPRLLTIWDTPIVVWSSFYKVSLLKGCNIRFQEEVRFGEDVCFNNIVLYYAKSYTAVDKYYVSYRLHQRSLSNTKGKKRIEPWINIIDGLLVGLERFQIKDEEYRQKTKDLCCWYLLEMSEAYYKSLSISDKPYSFIRTHVLGERYYKRYMNLSQREINRISFMLEHKHFFKAKFFLKGIIQYIKRVVLIIQPIRKYYEKRRFPLLQNQIIS